MAEYAAIAVGVGIDLGLCAETRTVLIVLPKHVHFPQAQNVGPSLEGHSLLVIIDICLKQNRVSKSARELTESVY